MTGKLDAALQAKLDAAGEENLEQEIPVIVTLAAHTEPEMLRDAGLTVRHVFRTISAVSGAIAAARIRSLADLPAVKTIEYDGPVQAFSQ